MTTIPNVTAVDFVGGLLKASPGLPQVIRTGIPFLALRPSSKISIGAKFQSWVKKTPNATFVRFEDQSYTYAESNAIINSIASVLREHGVRRHDVVGNLGRNNIETLFTTLAITKLGAVAGLINYNQRGEVLAHSVNLLKSEVLVYGDEFADAIAELAPGTVPAKVFTATELMAAAAALRASNPAAANNPPEVGQILGSDAAFYIFTSGTTGMPKASIMSHFRWVLNSNGIGGLGGRMHRSDVLYCPLPLYHNNAISVALGAVLSCGGTFALGEKFSATRFWDEVARFQATSFIYIGEVCRYLLNQPPKPTDKTNTVKMMMGNGLRPEIWNEFTERFGISRVLEFYAGSEINIAFVNALNLESSAGFCPLPYAVVKYDPDTQEPIRRNNKLVRARRGSNGLLLTKVTKKQPFEGYTDSAASESKLLRNAFRSGDCWYVTGDVVRNQGYMHVAFVDRLGDTFRWKGENVATTEVEGALLEDPSLTAAVVYGVQIPGADGRAGMAAVVLEEGASFDGAKLAKELTGRLPNYAIPLYVRVVDSLETTSTFKSRKVDLRNEGYTDVGTDPLYVWVGGAEGFAPAYPEFAADVVGARVPRS